MIEQIRLLLLGAMQFTTQNYQKLSKMGFIHGHSAPEGRHNFTVLDILGAMHLGLGVVHLSTGCSKLQKLVLDPLATF